MHRLLHGEIDNQRAGELLHKLQMASHRLSNEIHVSAGAKNTSSANSSVMS
jgi:hypothetical protein